MAFSDFDLRGAVNAFGLTVDHSRDLFADIQEMTPTPFLGVWLAEFAQVALGMGSETARREFIITPFLAEAKRRAVGPVHVHPGISVDVDRSRGLAGFCDYVVARSEEYFYLRSPLVAVVEAKRDDLNAGYGQCAAAMVAIRLFNEKDATPVPAEYGVVTSGSIWRFLKMTGPTLHIDAREYYLADAAKILGILVHIFGPPG